MVNGLDIFRQYFRHNLNDYILIGGVACDLVMNSIQHEFRLTQDFDIVIVSENLLSGFGLRLKEFIRDGGYTVQCRKSTGKPTFFRFINPVNDNFPSQLELASNKPAEDWISKFAPLNAGDAKSSLSAILFEPEYYDFIRHNTVIIDEISSISLAGLIPLKALAYLELTKIENPTVKDRISAQKHFDDILFLAETLPAGTFDLPPLVKANLQTVISGMVQQEINDERQERIDAIRLFYSLV